MKSRKGFTLVELLGVIVILAMIVLVTVPALITTLRNSEENEKQNFEKTLFLAAESYFQRNSEIFPQLYVANGKAFVQVGTLIEDGYIKESLVDPNTDEKIDSNMTIQAIMNSDGTFNYSFESLNLSYQSYVQTGLVLMYDGMQKVYGNKVEDLSTGGYDGVLHGVDANSGWAGDHIRFDGVDDYVEQVVPVSNDFTIEIVISNAVGASNVNKYGSLYTINNWVSANTDYPSLMLFYDARTNPSLTFRVLVPETVSDEAKEISLGTTLVTSLKTQNTFSFVKSGNSIKVYFNNTLVGSSTDASFINRFDMSTMNLKLGAWANSFAQFDMHSFRIYNKALSADELQSNYELDKTRF